MTFIALLLSALLQQAYSPSEFTQVQGASLKAKYDNAITQAGRAPDATFWVAYRFPVRPGYRINTYGDGTNISITSATTSDGIEWIPDTADVQRVGIFLLVGKGDGVIQSTRLINLSQNFRVHDRKVYWLGEPVADESLTLLKKLVLDSPQKYAGSLISYMRLHDSTRVAENLLELAKPTTNNPEVRRSAISYLAREVSRQAGDELNRLASDPNTDIQRQAVSAISRRNDEEAIPALIRVAKEHQNPAVRNYAIQLLAQKKDQRVIDFFEQLLKKQ